MSFRNGVLGASYLPVKIVFDPKIKKNSPKADKGRQMDKSLWKEGQAV